MKLLCDVCEKAVASVICCADEAALCLPCDAHIHAANKLASKHLRIAVLTDSIEPPSSCDICQERSSLFFCIEDRALLCRECDCSIHSTNPVAAKHRRFLLTGVKVGMDAMTAVTTAPSTSSSQETTSMVANSEQQAIPLNDMRNINQNKKYTNSSKKHKSSAQKPTSTSRSSIRTPSKTNSVQSYDIQTCEERTGTFGVRARTNKISVLQIQNTQKLEKGNKTLEPMMGLTDIDSVQSYASEQRGETTLLRAVFVQEQNRVQRSSEESEGVPLLRSMPRLSIQRLSTGSISFIAPVLSTLQVPCYEETNKNMSENNKSRDLEMESAEQKVEDAESLLEWRLEDLLTDLGDMCESGHPASPKLASCC